MELNKNIKSFEILSLIGSATLIAWSTPKILLAIFFRRSATTVGILQFLSGSILLILGIWFLFNKSDFIKNIKIGEENLSNKKIKKINFLFISLNSLIIFQILWFLIRGIHFMNFISLF